MIAKKPKKVTSQRKLISSSVPEASWYPHDISLFPEPILSDAVVTRAKQFLKLTNAEREAAFISRLRDIEATFRVERLIYDKPLPSWYYLQYERLQSSAEDTILSLWSIDGTARLYLSEKFKGRVSSASKMDIRSIELMLDNLRYVCAKLADKYRHLHTEEKSGARVRPSAREKIHFKAVAKELILLWNEFSEEQFVLNFRSAKGHNGIEYDKPCVQFAETILKGFSANISKDGVRNLLRADRKPKVQN